MKIGVMGGTFDPIHIGHLLLGQFAYEMFDLDEVWFLPNANPPHKDTDIDRNSLSHRIEMVRIAIDGIPHFKLSMHEADGKDHSYTYQTLEEFKAEYPDNEFYFILGADSLFSIEEWKYFEKIFPNCVILAAMRDDKDVSDMEQQIAYLQEKYQARIQLLAAPLLEISSTTIRNRAARKLSVHYMVPDLVAEYIEENQLYLDRP
ncbi:MAG: nicotinate-nucleotide adenylyltransferase [Hespellia sp.]|nr:nicotinate-nucleotide adenylyltransferase [Hespellia sp.]